MCSSSLTDQCVTPEQRDQIRYQVLIAGARREHVYDDDMICACCKSFGGPDDKTLLVTDNEKIECASCKSLDDSYYLNYLKYDSAVHEEASAMERLE